MLPSRPKPRKTPATRRPLRTFAGVRSNSMKFSVTRKVVLGFGLSLAILAVIGVASLHSISILIENMDRVAQCYRVQAELGDLTELAKDIQASVRGYVITGDEEFLGPFHEAMTEMPRQIREVEVLLQRKPEQASKLVELKKLLDAQGAYMNETIELRKTAGAEAAMNRVRAGEGKKRLDAIRLIRREMDAIENRLLAERSDDARRSSQLTLTIIVAGSILALVVVAAATLIIARDIRERERLEQSVLEAGEREQRRIGQELHDGLCQQLAGAAFMSRALEEELTERSPQQAAAAGRISELVNRSVNHARGIARGLHPVELQAGGLMSALEELASNTSAFFGVACRFECAKPVLVTDNNVAVHVYRIAQEAVHNAFRHAKTQEIRILLTADQGRAKLEIQDDGCGLPPAPVRPRGMGLDTMRYRADAIGAAFEIRSRPGAGTVVTCSFDAHPPVRATD